MPITVNHSLSATTPDNTSYEIRPSHWNESHVVTLDLGSNEVIKYISAGTNSVSSGNVQFANSNNVTFGMETNGVVTASASMAAGAGDGYNILAAGSQTANTTGSVIFNNANGVTFGMSNNSVITASHNGLTTAMASNRGSDFVQATAAFAGTSASGTIASNGISISIGPYLTTAMQSNAVTLSNIKVSAGTLSTNRSDMTFGNSNGISFGLETNGVITGTVATNYQSQGAYLTTAALSNHSHGNPTLALTNLTGTTASNSAGLTLSLSAAAPGAGGGIAAAAGSQTQTSGTVLFQNSNGITFGMSNSSVVTASHNGLTTAAQSDHSHGNPTLALTNLSGTTASASNGLTLSLSAAAPGGGAGVTLSEWNPIPASSLITNAVLGQNSLYFVPFDLPVAISAYRVNVFNSIATTLSASNATGSAAYTQSMCLYTRGTGTGTDRISSIWSGSFFQGFTNSSNTRIQISHPLGISNSTAVSSISTSNASSNFSTYLANSFAGLRAIPMPMSLTLSPGRYWMAIARSYTSANASFAMAISHLQQSNVNNLAYRPFGTSSAASNASFYNAAYPGGGTYSATSNAFPASVALTTNAIRGAPTMNFPFFNFSGYTTGTNVI